MARRLIGGVLATLSLAATGVQGQAVPRGGWSPLAAAPARPYRVARQPDEPLSPADEPTADGELQVAPGGSVFEDLLTAPSGEEGATPTDAQPADESAPPEDSGETAEAGASEDASDEGPMQAGDDYSLPDGPPLCGPGLPDDYGCWTFTPEYTFLDRSKTENVVFTRQVGPRFFPQFGRTFNVPIDGQGSGDLDTDFESGTRLTLSRDIFPDIAGRQHSVEITYTGLNDWEATSFALGSLVADSIGFESGSLQSPFPSAVGGFNRALVHNLAYNSDFHNLEINYRIRRGRDRDRMILTPSGRWFRDTTPGLYPSFLMGLRNVTVNERLVFTSSGLLRIPALNFEAPYSGVYDTVTHNYITTFQIGGDLTTFATNWSLGARCKVGVGPNFADMSSSVRINDQTVNAANRASRFREHEGEQASVVGEWGLVGTYRLRDNVSLRASYDMLWVQGIALAPEQADFRSLVSEGFIRTRGDTLFQGASFGLDVTW